MVVYAPNTACLIVEANDDISRIQDEPFIVNAAIRLQASPPPRDPDVVRRQICEELLGAALASLGEIEAYLISKEPLANTHSDRLLEGRKKQQETVICRTRHNVYWLPGRDCVALAQGDKELFLRLSSLK